MYMNQMFYKISLMCMMRFIVSFFNLPFLKCCCRSGDKERDLTAHGSCLRGRSEPTLGSYLCRKGGRFFSST